LSEFGGVGVGWGCPAQGKFSDASPSSSGLFSSVVWVSSDSSDDASLAMTSSALVFINEPISLRIFALMSSDEWITFDSVRWVKSDTSVIVPIVLAHCTRTAGDVSGFVMTSTRELIANERSPSAVWYFMTSLARSMASIVAWMSVRFLSW